MPQLPPVPSTSRVVLNWLWDGQRCANVLHFTNPSGPEAPDAPVVGNAIRNAFNGNLASHVPTNLTLTSILVTQLPAGSGPTVEFTGFLPVSGSSASPSMPNHVSVASKFNTGLRGRSYRGRAFNVGLTEATVTGNNIEAVHRDRLNAFWTALLSIAGGIGGATYKLAVVSYYANKTLRATPVVTAVTNVSTDLIVDSQRRRLPGRGR